MSSTTQMGRRDLILQWVGENAYRKGYRAVIEPWLSRPFSRAARSRIVVAYTANRISFSQVFPLLWYAQDLFEQHGCQVRFVPIDPLLNGARIPFRQVDHFLVQPWFDVPHETTTILLDQIKSRFPEASIGFLDAYAHSDLRLARVLEPYVDLYFKKSLFRDPAGYCKSYCGDTNLTDYYGHLYNLQSEPSDWNVPAGFTDRLRLWPGFFTAPSLLPGFLAKPARFADPRPIDVHARLARKGTPWYQAMRQASIRSLAPMDDLNIVAEGSVSWKAFMSEMRRAKLCFSPFGYGELCWRDLEAFLTGSVLAKPDMSHLVTRPDLYEPWVTYVPLAWDFSDVEPVMRGALQDPDQLARISQTAFERVADYLTSNRFVDQIASEVLRPGSPAGKQAASAG